MLKMKLKRIRVTDGKKPGSAEPTENKNKEQKKEKNKAKNC